MRSCLVKTDPSVVLRYAAFGAVPIRAQSWVVWRRLWDLTCWVTARPASCVFFRTG